MTYFLGFLWGFVLVGAFAGWGLALRKLLRHENDEMSPDWGPAIVLGMSLIIAIGGFLNLLSVMVWGVVLVLVVVGLALFVATVLALLSQAGWKGVFDWPATKFDAIAGAGCILNYAAVVCFSFSPYIESNLRQRFTLNSWDDLNGGYVTLPIRLLSEGNLGADPFNSDRSLALGGHSLLQSFALAILPPTYIHILDPGLALLTIPLVLHGMSRRRGWPGWLAPVLTIFCLVLRSPRVSSSPSLLPTVFLLTVFGELETLAARPRADRAALWRLAFLSAAVMTFKNTLVPGTCLILGLYFILDGFVRRNFRRAMFSGLVLGSIVLLLLSPWFAAMYPAAGTPLYPLLGEGYRGTHPMIKLPRPAPIQEPIAELREFVRLSKDPRIILTTVLACLGLVASTRRRFRDGRGVPFVTITLASATVLTLYARTFAGDWLRYGYNFLSLSLVASFALLAGEADGRTFLDRLLPGGTRWLSFVLVSLTIAGVAYQTQFIPQTAEMITTAIAGREWDPSALAPYYRKAQEAIPAGQRFVAFLPMAHLLDYRRNPINVIDAMCGISPPPGIPLRSGPEDVARYLRSLGISRILTREKRWFPAGETTDVEDFRRWSEGSKDPWTSSQIYSYYLVARCMGELATLYEPRHFEDYLVLIDLDQPRRR